MVLEIFSLETLLNQKRSHDFKLLDWKRDRMILSDWKRDRMILSCWIGSAIAWF
jgi:hypothetical protein